MAKKTAKKMRMGKVILDMEYPVDLDNESMIEEAKNCLIEDLMNMAKYGEYGANIDVIEDKSLSPGDIPEFLNPENE